MQKPQPLLPERRRNIRQCTFGWVDHNFLHRGYLRRLSQEELLLYYFLVTVADRNGVSFYDYARICQWLKLELDAYLRARNRLCELSLIAYHDGVFQVLSLPEPTPRPREIHAVETAASSHQQDVTASDFQSLKALLQNLSRPA